MDARTTIHEIVDRLSDDELDAAKRLLERLHSDKTDPMLKLLANAPYDDEPTTPEEDASCREAIEAAERGEFISAEETKRKYL